MVAQAVSGKIGQPVVVENVGGGGGTIALRNDDNCHARRIDAARQ
jgi:tripartite-type tricarboxylate transporter receptor subunit TctC